MYYGSALFVCYVTMMYEVIQTIHIMSKPQLIDTRVKDIAAMADRILLIVSKCVTRATCLPM